MPYDLCSSGDVGAMVPWREGDAAQPADQGAEVLSVQSLHVNRTSLG